MLIEDSNEPHGVIDAVLKEKEHQFKRELISFNGVRAGDFTNDKHEFLLERKKDLDYLVTLTKGRLYKQWAHMADNFDGVKYFAFVGDWNALLNTAAKMSPSVYWNIKYSRVRASAYNIHWMNFKSDRELALFLLDLDKEIGNNIGFSGEKDKVYVSPNENSTIKSLSVIVGRKACTNLLKKYKNIKNIFSQLETNHKDLLKVGGVGKSRLAALQKYYNEEVNLERKRKKTNSRKNGKFSAGKRKFFNYQHTYRIGQNQHCIEKSR